VRRSLLAQFMLVALGVITASRVIGMVELWPRGPKAALPPNSTLLRTEQAEATSVERAVPERCRAHVPARHRRPASARSSGRSG
jgi:hypothetical protein